MPRAHTIFENDGLIVVEASVCLYQKIAFTPLDFYSSST
jgi:hypothetical protein